MFLMFLNTCTFWDCLSKSGGLFVFNVLKYLKTSKPLKTIKNKGSFSGNCFLCFLIRVPFGIVCPNLQAFLFLMFLMFLNI